VTIKTFLPIILAASLFGTAPAAASMPPEEYCGVYSSLATTVMRLRQQGTLMHEQVETVLEVFADNPDRLSIMMRYIDSAYKIPRFADSGSQEAAVEGFGNGTYKGCLEAVTE
jgi:hypothetical protein